VEAIVLCGGLGTRLRPLVADRPKSMALVQGHPFIYYLIVRLQKCGIKRMILAVGYLHEQIIAYCGDGSEFGVEIRYSVETLSLGTAGAVKQAAALVTREDFLVLNGDTYTQCAYAALRAEHLRQQADLTLALRQVTDPGRYGRVELDITGRVVGFGEKQPVIPAGTAWVNAGVYVMNRRVLNLIPGGHPYALETELIPCLLQTEARVSGYRTTGYFRDIGIPEDYCRFNDDVAAGVLKTTPI
jgi:D-glycero-alpha-D-manno-heptose 1-phosphate guanylyltransferase